MWHKFIVFFCLILLTVFSGCVTAPVNGAGNNQTSAVELSGAEVDALSSMINKKPEIAAYVLKPLDPIYIRFSGVLDQQQLELVIDEHGDISLLHIKQPIKAAGLTTSALEDEIERLYIDGGIYKNVAVNVTMTAKVYYVQGEVKQPGQFQLMSGTTLLQAIAGSRGYTAFANKKKVTINRQGKVYTYNAKELEKDPSMDVKIEAGDVVQVHQQWY